ncbi:MAG: MurR/RpiR family transcriptional regulator, partial [Paracoccaceae bacterium]
MGPGQKNDILETLKDEFENFSPKIKDVAKYISDNPEGFALESMRRTAAKIGVSTFTLTRMAEVLGFKSFEDLRRPFRQSLSVGPGPGGNPDWVQEPNIHD